VDELGDTAERILQFIEQNPGCHLRKIKVMMHIIGNSSISRQIGKKWKE
jgi:hypothetical protein